jgi:hypothetical protein
MPDHDDLYAACLNYVGATDHDDDPNDAHVRAVYDAAARILDIHPDHTDDDDHAVWQLRAAYIDAFAAYLHATGPTDGTDLVAARDALVAATTGHKVTR